MHKRVANRLTSPEEKEFNSLCQSDPKPAWKFFPSPYWTAEVYSFGKYIRQYGRFPSFLPLCIFTDHGAGSIDYPAKHEIESDAPCQFYHSPKTFTEWKKISTKSCYVLYSPFVFYRRKNRIEKATDAKGTIAFPAHTTTVIDDASDIEIYIKQLLELPQAFQPVSVCLHLHDINKGRHKIFFKHKIPVYTAGNGNDYRFCERFYNILKMFRYSMSNMVGSYTYYSVEMGIPFSIYGNKQIFINTGDPNVPMGEYDPYKEFPSYRKAYDMFNGLYTEITQEQREIVETDLGLRDGISRAKMAYVLYSSFIKWAFLSTRGIKFVMSEGKKSIQRRLS